MQAKPKLSKSQYLKGLQCPLALWYYRHRKDLAPEINLTTQARFDEGNEVGKLAQFYFANCVEVTDEYWEIAKAAKSTQKFIEDGHEVIFEATGIHPTDGGYARIDILRKVPDTDEWDLIEVKSSTEVKNYHIDDLAFQYHVFYNAGFKIRKCFMMVIDNKYIRASEIDPKKLFRLEDISEQVYARQGDVEYWAGQLGYVLDRKDEPKKEIGVQCFTPFECDYRDHCWRHVSEYSVYNIYQKKKAVEIVNQIESHDIKDIPPALIPNGIKAIDVACYQDNKPHVEKENIKTFLDGLVFPLYYLDYETLAPAIPLFDGTRPFQQIPFQFSLHIQEEPNGDLKHYEFIHKEMRDPRKNFTEELVKRCGDHGSIIVYNQSFEEGRNRELAEAFPIYAKYLEEINARMVDLLVPFRKRWLYHPDQKGSASIKSVLPTFTEVSYEGLDITNGSDASIRYMAFAKGILPEHEQEKLWSDLIEYCKLDTYAMVALAGVLRSNIC